MSDTNYFSGIVKILDNPVQTFIKNQILKTTCQVELPQIRQNKAISLVFWGNLAQEVKNYYQINDYVLIEGYVSLKENKSNLLSSNSKKLTITVLKVSPFLLNSLRQMQKK